LPTKPIRNALRDTAHSQTVSTYLSEPRMNKNDLSKELSKCDRKHTDHLIEIYQNNQGKPEFLDKIIDVYVSCDDLEHSTTWLIKHFIDNGTKLSQTQADKVLANISKLDFWESKLHILQITPKINLTLKNAKLIEPSVNTMMKSDKKFVKAAAYEAYFEIVKLIPELRNEFTILCENALETESASIKSKVKRILKQIKTGANNGSYVKQST